MRPDEIPSQPQEIPHLKQQPLASLLHKVIPEGVTMTACNKLPCAILHSEGRFEGASQHDPDASIREEAHDFLGG